MTPKNHKRAVTRRARQNKRSGSNNSTQDLNTQNSMLGSRKSDTLTWGVISGAIPRFGSLGRKDNKVYSFTQQADLGEPLTSSTTVPTSLGISFTATSHLAQFGSFATIFDQYRIMEIECWIYANTTTINASVGGGNLSSVVDYDDDANPSTGGANPLLQYQNLVISPINDGHYHKFRPHIAMAAYSGAFTSFANITSPWIDVASNAVKHYGVKLWCDATSPNTVQFRVLTRIAFQMRNVF